MSVRSRGWLAVRPDRRLGRLRGPDVFEGSACVSVRQAERVTLPLVVGDGKELDGRWTVIPLSTEGSSAHRKREKENNLGFTFMF